ncbi:NID [Mytilus coruscus]|uniref:NID n=1 Tax=Mytilus coruscus TaxID=42192 RepID=A0A6J8CHL7_MYTCO|nr:NID [Mytilus coruscus]
MNGLVLKLYSIFILTLQTDGFILPNQTEFHSIQDVCINDIFSFDFMTRRSSGLLVHLESDNSKQNQFTVTIEDGELVFTYRVNNKKRSSIIPYDDTEMVNKWNDNRWHKLIVERILDEGKYLSVKVLVDEQIHRLDSVMEVKGHVRGSNDVYLGKTPYVDVKNAIYINCNCLKMHLKIGEDRSEVDKCCQEINRENKETKKCGGVLGKIKCRNQTTSGVSMSVAACLEGARYLSCQRQVWKRLILRGIVNGVLNNKAIENVDLLSYVYTTNGRIETLIRRKQNTARTMMKILQPIGDIIGWMFAVPQEKKAKNGFMMTGGELNRTSFITYHSGEFVVITQQFFTFLSELRVQTYVKGTVPDYVGSILFNGFKEQHKSVSTGVIKSCSTRRYEMNGLTSYFTVDQILVFNECQFSPFRYILHSMRHVVILNDRKNDVLRFTSTNQIQALDGYNGLNRAVDEEFSNNIDSSGMIKSYCRPDGGFGVPGKFGGAGVDSGWGNMLLFPKPDYNAPSLKENENHQSSTTVIMTSTTTNSPEISSGKVYFRYLGSNVFKSTEEEVDNMDEEEAELSDTMEYSGSNYSTDEEADISDNIYIVDVQGKREGTTESFFFSTFTEDTVTINTMSPTAGNVTEETHTSKKALENDSLQRRSVFTWILGCFIMSVWSLSV